MANLIRSLKYCSSEGYKHYRITMAGNMANANKEKDVVLTFELFIFKRKEMHGMHKATVEGSEQTVLH